MEQRDLIKDQIEQLGKVLGKILAGFTGFLAKGQIIDGTQSTAQQLQEQLDINLVQLKTLSLEELQSLYESKNFQEEQLETMAQLLFKIGKVQSDKIEAKLYLTKAIETLQLANLVSKTLSLTRIQKINEIQELIKLNAFPNNL